MKTITQCIFGTVVVVGLLIGTTGCDSNNSPPPPMEEQPSDGKRKIVSTQVGYEENKKILDSMKEQEAVSE